MFREVSLILHWYWTEQTIRCREVSFKGPHSEVLALQRQDDGGTCLREVGGRTARDGETAGRGEEDQEEFGNQV